MIRALFDRLDRQHELLDRLDRRAERVETIVMVREPASTAAADAYEGLRRQVLAAMSERLAHLAQLAQFDTALRAGASAAELRSLVAGWLAEAGLDRVDDAAHERADVLFEVVGDGEGPLRVLAPAYLDSRTDRVVQTGRATRAAGPV